MDTNKPPVLLSINTYIAEQDLYTTQTILLQTTEVPILYIPFTTFPHLFKENITLQSIYHCT